MWSQQLQAQLEGRDLIHNRPLASPCDDLRPAADDRAFFIPHHIYCSGRNRRWNGALPALDHTHNEQAGTLARAWLLSSQQVLHLLRQINNDEHLTIDWQYLLQHGHYDARDRGHGRVMALGERDSALMLTVTSPLGMDERRAAPPSDDYLQAWTCGLRECFGLNTVGIRKYFNAIPGIPSQSHGQVQRFLDCALAWSTVDTGGQEPTNN
ncbi:MAG: hypothetical protein EA401_04635 [Planctomycetota bacterium]|nr:MAG: hypothetical protein EA401_04635 [Planctomycetota bacterium]